MRPVALSRPAFTLQPRSGKAATVSRPFALAAPKGVVAQRVLTGGGIAKKVVAPLQKRTVINIATRKPLSTSDSSSLVKPSRKPALPSFKTKKTIASAV